MTAAPRVFGVDYHFLSAGDVFTEGLAHAAEALNVPYAHTDWSHPRLRDQVRAFAPDLLLVVHGRKFAQRYPRRIAEGSAAVWLVDEPYEVDSTARYSPAFDHVFVNDASTRDRHARAVYLPTCYDPILHYATTRPPAGRVGFIGIANPTREAYLSALAATGLLDVLVGDAWTTPALQRLRRARVVTPRAAAALYRDTAIVVNVFLDRDQDNRAHVPATALNPRIYEATACGALVISQWRSELTTRVPSMPTFRSVDECVALVAAFSADAEARQARASACRAELAADTYAARLQTILATVRQPLEVA